jgi:hypothetical protein
VLPRQVITENEVLIAAALWLHARGVLDVGEQLPPLAHQVQTSTQQIPNAVFHLGATLASRTYCAGAVIGLLVYVPLSAVLARLVAREGLLGPAVLLVAFAAALAVHVLEVGHNVFKRW